VQSLFVKSKEKISAWASVVWQICYPAALFSISACMPRGGSAGGLCPRPPPRLRRRGWGAVRPPPAQARLAGFNARHGLSAQSVLSCTSNCKNFNSYPGVKCCIPGFTMYWAAAALPYALRFGGHASQLLRLQHRSKHAQHCTT
jgi:hypothetical protein